MSDRVEDELRAMLQGRASTVTGAPDPVGRVEAGVRRMVLRRRVAVTGGVPVLVGAIVGGAGLLSGHPEHHVAEVVAVPTPSTSSAAPRSSDFPRPFDPVPTRPTSSSPSLAPLSSANPSFATPSSVPRPSAPPSATAPTPAADPQTEVYRAYLEEAPQPRELGVVNAAFGGRPYCALRVLDQSTRYAYLWVFCNEYYLKAGVLTSGSGDSLPVRLTISGTGATTRVVGVAIAQSGQGEQAELKKLFSPLAFSRSQRYSSGVLGSPGVDESAVQLKARALADVQSGRLRTGLNPIAP